MDPQLANVGTQLRFERDRLGLSLAQLANLAGISKAYLVRLETDPTSNPSLEVLRRIADALDITIADLIGRPPLRFDVDDVDIPASLKVFADEAQLTQREVETLASIRWRKGEEPRAPERWRYIWQSLRASRHFDDQET